MSDELDGMLRLAKRTATVCAVAALMFVILLGIASAIDVLLIIFIGVLFAIVLHSLAKKLARSVHGDGRDVIARCRGVATTAADNCRRMITGSENYHTG